MANKYRGELEVSLNGKSYLLRPTFEALVEFEDKAGMTAYEAIRLVTERNAAPMKSVAGAFWAGIKAAWAPDGGRCPSYGEVGAMIQREGLANLLVPYLQFLTNALSSDNDLKQAAAESKAVEGSAGGKEGPPSSP